MELLTVFVAGALLILSIWWWRRVLSYPRPRSVAISGLDPSTRIPSCTEDVELFYNDLSAHSLKVRVCLSEAGIPFKAHRLALLPWDGFDTKTPAFLAVNPAGTVPVLVHQGHPVYESLEQMIYVAKALAPVHRSGETSPPPLLLPPGEKEADRVVAAVREIAQLNLDDLFSDPTACLRRSPTNTIFPMTIPLFCALIAQNCCLFTVMKILAWVPFLTAKTRRFLGLVMLVKLFGVAGLKKIGPLMSVARNVRWALDFHLGRLEAALGVEGSAGPYLYGDLYTLADICWVPFLQRLEQARWWPEFEGKYPLVHAYWRRIKEREATGACQPERAMKERLTRAGLLLDAWKAEHNWFREIYTGQQN